MCGHPGFDHSHDGSGSVREAGCDILTIYAQAMQAGVLEFGNGIIMDDGVIVSPAMSVQPLFDEISPSHRPLEV